MTGEFDLSEGWGDTREEINEQSWAWMHVPARKTLRVAMLSRAPVRYRGHWVEGGMAPCVPEGCRWCELRMGSQVRYCFAVYELDSRSCGLLEVSAAAADVVRASAEKFTYLRGLVFTFAKEGGRDRGKVSCKALDQQVNVQQLPEGADPREHLERMWRTKFPAVRPFFPASAS